MLGHRRAQDHRQNEQHTCSGRTEGGPTVGAVILGLVAGGARILVPGDAFKGMKGPMSWVLTFVLGIAGAFVGWLIFTQLCAIGTATSLDLGGIIGAIVGAVILLVVFTLIMRRTGRA